MRGAKHDQGWIGSDPVGLTSVPEILYHPALAVLTYTLREPESSRSRRGEWKPKMRVQHPELTQFSLSRPADSTSFAAPRTSQGRALLTDRLAPRERYGPTSHDRGGSDSITITEGHAETVCKAFRNPSRKKSGR